MNTQKSVFKKIAKINEPNEVEHSEVELSNQIKVEFALIDELEKAVDSLNENSKAVNDWIKDYDNKVITALRSAGSQIQTYIKQKPTSITTSFAEGIVDNAIKQGRELGVDMKNNASVKRLEFAINSLKEANKGLDKVEALAERQLKKLRG
jgi:hypothetical protein